MTGLPLAPKEYVLLNETGLVVLTKKATMDRSPISCIISLAIQWLTNIPMRLGSHDLGYSVRQSRGRVYMKDWKRVLPVDKTSRRQNDGYKMSASVMEQRK